MNVLVANTVFKASTAWRDTSYGRRPFYVSQTQEVEAFSTDMQAALLLIPAMKKRGYTVQPLNGETTTEGDDPEYEVIRDSNSQVVGRGIGPQPLALCRAVLRALGEQV